MKDSERFIQTMNFGCPDRMPFWECAMWPATLDRWVEEGMPREVAERVDPDSSPTEQQLRSYFGYDRSFGVYFRRTVKINIEMYPGFEYRILSEENGVVTEICEDGVIMRRSKETETKQFLKFPVENSQDFQAIKKQFDPHDVGRYTSNWKEHVLELQAAGAPTCIRSGGYYGFARSLMGFENLSLAFCDQPELIEEIFEFRTEFIVQILEKILREVKPDFAEFWEDMAYKTASLVSPKLYRKMALKHYRKVTDLLAKYGVNIVLLDSDGNIDELIPIWLDAGINCVWPLEIASGMDPVALRRKYGKTLGLIGGIDKRALALGKESIKEEVMSKVPYLVETGGYIPTCDHAVPNDISFENYTYYLELIKGIGGVNF